VAFGFKQFILSLKSSRKTQFIENFTKLCVKSMCELTRLLRLKHTYERTRECVHMTHTHKNEIKPADKNFEQKKMLAKYSVSNPGHLRYSKYSIFNNSRVGLETKYFHLSGRVFQVF
jgi:hypothetical protein